MADSSSIDLTCARAWALLEAHPGGISKPQMARLMYGDDKRRSSKFHELLVRMDERHYPIAEGDDGNLSPCYLVVDWPWEHPVTRRAQMQARRLP